MPPFYKVSMAKLINITINYSFMFLNPFYISLLTQFTVLIKIIEEKQYLLLSAALYA